MKLIDHLKALLDNVDLRTNLIKELVEIRENTEMNVVPMNILWRCKYRRLIADENVVITISHAGY
jgi:DNA gyrase subunit A